jgi:hypothetical protein
VISAIIAPVVLGALPRVLIGLMAADQTARSSPEQSVMAGIMPRHETAVTARANAAGTRITLMVHSFQSIHDVRIQHR